MQLYDAWGKPTQAAEWKQKLAAFQQAIKAVEKKGGSSSEAEPRRIPKRQRVRAGVAHGALLQDLADFLAAQVLSGHRLHGF